MGNRTRTIWNIVCGTGTILGIVDFGLSHFNINVKEMVQFLEQNILSIIGITGFILLVAFNIYWKVKDYVTGYENQINILKQIVNNHAIKISEQDRHGVKRIDMVRYYDAQLLQQNTPLTLNVLYFPSEDKFSKYIEGKLSEDELNRTEQ